MKYKTTKRELTNNYHHIISIGYCDVQFLLKYRDPQSYCTRVEGWACDNYDVNGVLISTGYAPVKSKNTIRDYDTTREFEQKAITITGNYDLKWEEQKAALEILLKEYIERCIESYKEANNG
jgi:hypothetical protein